MVKDKEADHMKNQIIWLSYDLSIDGDYENLYTWLDKHGARECGDNIAFLLFSFKKDLVAEIKKSLKDIISIRKKDRIYMIFEDGNGKAKGRFIFGRRKAAPWRGYAEISDPNFWDEAVS